MDEQPQLGHIRPSMDVCDVEGERVGSVAGLYRREHTTERPSTDSDRPGVLEVKTGPFGWGTRLYIPMNAVQDATREALFLSRPRRDLDPAWRKKLDDLVPVR
jgi:hypothetical protein